MPSFIVKNGAKRQPQKRGCFSCIFGFFFPNFFVFSPNFSLVPAVSCHLGSWNPQTAHQMRLQAIVGSLKTLTSLNKEVRPFFLGDNSIWSFPSVCNLSLAIKAFGAFQFSVPKILLSLRKYGL